MSIIPYTHILFMDLGNSLKTCYNTYNTYNIQH